jgi:shikimate kinase
LIFDVEGEQGFRERESRLIDDLSQECGIVLATGGGAVLAKTNRDILAERGIVIFLSGSPELLMKRTAHDHNRPLLETTDRLGKIKSLLKERQELYGEVADMTLVVDKLSVRQIIERISDFIKQT